MIVSLSDKEIINLKEKKQSTLRKKALVRNSFLKNENQIKAAENAWNHLEATARIPFHAHRSQFKDRQVHFVVLQSFRGSQNFLFFFLNYL